jgi:16S rRNA (guanine527-N7)-methyltransferase
MVATRPASVSAALNCASDSAEIPLSHQLLPQGASLFDIGSGAGLPGIVIALARPDLSVTLIEPLERRVAFLTEAVEGLNIEVIRGRA